MRKQRKAKFDLAKETEAAIVALGARRNTGTLMYDWWIDTRDGFLLIHPTKDAIFTCFDDHNRASFCGPHNGKWNHHVTDDNGQFVLECFLHSLKSILRTDGVVRERCSNCFNGEEWVFGDKDGNGANRGPCRVCGGTGEVAPAVAAA